METESAIRRRLIRRPALLLLGAVLFPALLSTLLVWRFLPDWWQLSGFFWYSIPGNSFVWLPHEPAVIYAGTLYAPALVAVVAGMATTLASIIDHALFTRMFQSERLAPVGRSRVMRVCVRLFAWHPWWTIVFFAFTPIPFYPIRLVAPLARYPMAGYVSAVVFGRVPRYFLLALGGVWAKQLSQAFLPL